MILLWVLWILFYAGRGISMKAAVIGGTGAVGKEVVGQLLCSGKWSLVTTIGRREVTVPDAYPEEGWKAKLEQKKINMDNFKEEGQEGLKDVDAVFCALGTTRGVAGSADNFRKVDLHYVEAAAEASKAAGAKHFSLVTAQGANPNTMANDMKPFHALLYMKVKGQAEEAVKKQGFERTSIFRPGLLDRGTAVRGFEKLMSKVATSVKTSSVARAMILDAERYIGTSEMKPGVAVFEMAAIKKSGEALEPQPPDLPVVKSDEL